MSLPFTKAHGAKNDFLLTWASDARVPDLATAARAICDRHTGIGADGWILVSPAPHNASDHDAAIRIFNSDGSEAEISGNGTRCAAAFLADSGVIREKVRIQTGAGVKQLRLRERSGMFFCFEMNMGRPVVSDRAFTFALSTGSRLVTLIEMGNPQCAVEVESFDFDWRRLGAEIERHPHFPNRTNVSFFRRVDDHSIEARFYERGAGETMSSGTGASGAAVAAILHGVVKSPVRVLTLADPLDVSWEGDVFLTGPAEIVARGEFYGL